MDLMSVLDQAKKTSCAMIGIEAKLTLTERQKAAKLGFHLAASRKFGYTIVTWPQSERIKELREKILKKRRDIS